MPGVRKPSLSPHLRDGGSKGKAQPRPQARPVRRGRLLPLLLAVLVAAGCTALGLWQIDRAAQKTAWLEVYQAALDSTHLLPLASALDDSAALPRRVEGRVEVAEELPWLLLDNQRRGANIGVRAYRVAFIAGAAPARALLLEYGWLPLPPDRTLPSLPAPDRSLQLTGLLLPAPSAGLRLGNNPPARAQVAPLLVAYIDTAELATQLGIPLHASVLRPDPDPSFGFERDREALPNTLPPEKHYGYAFQWFGLAATVVIITLVLLLRRRPL
jgi:surfeit locus 1 family protein